MLFKLRHTEKLQLLALFPMHFSSDLTKTIYNVGNNILQDCLIQDKSYGVP